MKKRKVISVIIFVGVVLLIGTYLTKVFARKESSKIWNEFYAQPENSIDVVIFGSSLTECAIEPYYLGGKTNCSVFNLSMSGQTTSVRGYLLKEVLKTQSPKLVIMETYRYTGEPAMNINTIANSIDGMRFSRNKLELIRNVPIEGQESDRMELFVPLFASHNRWNSLGKEDFINLNGMTVKYKRGWTDGHVGIEAQPACVKPGTERANVVDAQKPYLDEIISLAKENDISLLFFNPPNPEIDENGYRNYNAIYGYLEEQGVEYLDCNYAEEFISEIDTTVDYTDYHHVNLAGAYKTTGYLAEYINKNYSFENGNHMDSAEYGCYLQNKEEKVRAQADLYAYLMYLYDDDFVSYISVSDTYRENNDETALRLLHGIEAKELTMEMQTQLGIGDNEISFVIKNKYTDQVIDIANVFYGNPKTVIHEVIPTQ